MKKIESLIILYMSLIKMKFWLNESHSNYVLREFVGMEVKIE